MPTSVPNQRLLTVSKEPTNKANLFTANNLEALGQAAKRLQSKGGFKLYMYLAKNQDKYSFYLSSTDFCEWSGLGIAAYRSAFEELKKEGYLIPRTDNEKETIFTFYDKSSKKDETKPKIENPKEKVEEIQKTKAEIETEFKNNY